MSGFLFQLPEYKLHVNILWGTTTSRIPAGKGVPQGKTISLKFVHSCFEKCIENLRLDWETNKTRWVCWRYLVLKWNVEVMKPETIALTKTSAWKLQSSHPRLERGISLKNEIPSAEEKNAPEIVVRLKWHWNWTCRLTWAKQTDGPLQLYTEDRGHVREVLIKDHTSLTT